MKIFLLGRFPASFADVERQLIKLEFDPSHKHYGRNVDLVIVGGSETSPHTKTMAAVTEDERRGAVKVVRFDPSTFWNDFERKMNVRVRGERPCPPPFLEEGEEPVEVFAGRRLMGRLRRNIQKYLLQKLRAASLAFSGREIPPSADATTYAGECAALFVRMAWSGAGIVIVREGEEEEVRQQVCDEKMDEDVAAESAASFEEVAAAESALYL